MIDFKINCYASKIRAVKNWVFAIRDIVMYYDQKYEKKIFSYRWENAENNWKLGQKWPSSIFAFFGEWRWFGLVNQLIQS